MAKAAKPNRKKSKGRPSKVTRKKAKPAPRKPLNRKKKAAQKVRAPSIKPRKVPKRKRPLRKPKGVWVISDKRASKKDRKEAEKQAGIIDQRLRVLAVKLKSYDPFVRVTINNDASVDAEIRLRKASQTFRDPHNALLDLEEQWTTPRGFWVGSGFLVDQKKKQKETSPLRRYKGHDMILLHPQKGRYQGENFLTARGILGRLEKKDYDEPDQVLVRFHWNPEGQRPNGRW